MSESPQEHLDRRVREFYGSEIDEGWRLAGAHGGGLLEFERTQELVRDRVPSGSRVLDVGGATGVHAIPLARDGYEVVLVDPVPEQVARAAAAGGFVAEVGDARSLDEPDASYDAALLLGPLYHLHTRADRLLALAEARRVVRPGGWVFAAAVSRLVTTSWACFLEPALRPDDVPPRSPLPVSWGRLIADGEGALGGQGFPGGHFHLAEELEEELRESGLLNVEVRGLEGPAGLALEVSRSTDPALLDAARTLARAFDSTVGARDLSAHLLGLGRVPR